MCLFLRNLLVRILSFSKVVPFVFAELTKIHNLLIHWNNKNNSYIVVTFRKDDFCIELLMTNFNCLKLAISKVLVRVVTARATI